MYYRKVKSYTSVMWPRRWTHVFQLRRRNSKTITSQMKKLKGYLASSHNCNLWLSVHTTSVGTEEAVEAAGRITYLLHQWWGSFASVHINKDAGSTPGPGSLCKLKRFFWKVKMQVWWLLTEWSYSFEMAQLRQKVDGTYNVKDVKCWLYSWNLYIIFSHYRNKVHCMPKFCSPPHSRALLC